MVIEMSAKSPVPGSPRAKSLDHADPAEVALQDALEALADPMRRSIVRALSLEPDFTQPCGAIELPVSRATASHHFSVLRRVGLLEQVDRGRSRFNRLRRAEFEARFPGLLALVLEDPEPPQLSITKSWTMPP
jgi:DNA-binding transcriptional ArsR family regulator